MFGKNMHMICIFVYMYVLYVSVYVYTYMYVYTCNIYFIIIFKLVGLFSAGSIVAEVIS